MIRDVSPIRHEGSIIYYYNQGYEALKWERKLFPQRFQSLESWGLICQTLVFFLP